MQRLLLPVFLLALAASPTATHADQKGGGTIYTGPLDCEHEMERVQKCENKGTPPQRVCEWVWVDKGCAVFLQKKPARIAPPVLRKGD